MARGNKTLNAITGKQECSYAEQEVDLAVELLGRVEERERRHQRVQRMTRKPVPGPEQALPSWSRLPSYSKTLFGSLNVPQ